MVSLGRGNTVPVIINVNVPTSEFLEFHTTFSQNDRVIVTKTMNDCEIGEDFLYFVLKEEDTFYFDHRLPLEIQLRVMYLDNTIRSSGIMTISVSELLEEEMMTDVNS